MKREVFSAVGSMLSWKYRALMLIYILKCLRFWLELVLSSQNLRENMSHCWRKGIYLIILSSLTCRDLVRKDGRGMHSRACYNSSFNVAEDAVQQQE
ncbi:hypothetical protein N431DRAFT_199667 [Stipitochalara longipes BDJ]|nr:hypothetical protein N431DRAFT_199667 [Stipitochalara longipes BDJ]